MISKNEIKYFSSLLNKKYRKKEKKFIAEGEKLVLEGINSNYPCRLVITTHIFAEENSSLIKIIEEKNIEIKIVKNNEFNKLSDTINPQGILGVFSYVKLNDFLLKDISDRIVVCLENISDPGNLGTILRTCDWFGIENILITKDSVDVYNPKVVRSSMGSIFHLNIYDDFEIKNDIKLFKNKNYKISVTDLTGISLFEYKLPDKLLLFLSNESSGPSKELVNIADDILTIPRYGKAESLNVAAASAVILSHLVK